MQVTINGGKEVVHEAETEQKRRRIQRKGEEGRDEAPQATGRSGDGSVYWGAIT